MTKRAILYPNHLLTGPVGSEEERVECDPFSLDECQEKLKSYKKITVYPLAFYQQNALLQGDQEIYEWIIEDNYQRISNRYSLEVVRENQMPQHFSGNRQFRVSSLQQCWVDSNWSAQDFAQSYFSWLGSFLFFFLHIVIYEDMLAIKVRFLPLILLKFREQHSTSEHSIIRYEITGGALSSRRQQGFLEFRRDEKKSLGVVALLNYTPSLYWWFYRFTQAVIHCWVMSIFVWKMNQKYFKGEDQ